MNSYTQIQEENTPPKLSKSNSKEKDMYADFLYINSIQIKTTNYKYCAVVRKN